MPNTSASSTAPIELRTLLPGDLPDLLRIQQACYGHDLVECEEVYARRLASPANCSLAARRGDRLCAYLAAYRSLHGKVTPLHGDFGSVEVAPDTLYLHDMAVSPSHAGQGLALALLELAWGQARAAGLRRTALVSVQDSRAYWARHGYSPRPLHDRKERARLASYGAGAFYMVRTLDSD